MRRGADTVVRTSVHAKLSWTEYGLHRLVASLTHNSNLVLQLTRREIATRYKGSVLGMAWSFVTPLIMLAIYTFVFSTIFQARWDVELRSRGEFALVLFAGLIVFQLVAECIGRAPALINENISYVKRVVFPLEALAWVVVGSAGFNAIVSFVILLGAHVFMIGAPPVTIFWLPVVVLPMLLITCGLVWFLASVGLYVKDVRQVVAVVIPMLMFGSPVFYPISALPEGFRSFMLFNPLAFTIEQVRNTALFGTAPDFLWLGAWFAVSLAVAWGGLVWFLVTKRGFADVV